MPRRRADITPTAPPAALTAVQTDLSPASAKRRAIGLALLLLAGLALWVFDLQAEGLRHIIVLGAIAALVAIPPVRRSLDNFLNRLRHPSRRSRWLIAALLTGVAGVYLFLTAWWQGTDFLPRVVDESSYLLQTQMLAHGMLWADPHPPEIQPFFDSFNLLVEPKYGSMYFPGTALLNVPGIWFGLPYWAIPLAMSAVCVGLLYLLATELLDGVYGLVAALMLLGLTKFRALSVMLFSQTPMLMFGLLMLLAYGQWRRKRGVGWAIVIGVLAGWAGITRPADALCYAVAIGVAMLLDLRGRRDRDPDADRVASDSADAASQSLPVADRAAARQWFITVAAMIAGGLPFLGLQVVQNAGMTGHWWEFPEARYADETYPASMLGFHQVDPAKAPKPALPQKRELNEEMVESLYREHQPANLPRVWWNDRLPETLTFGLPHPLIASLLLPGVLGLTTRRRRVVAGIAVLFFGFYACYVFYIPHYMIVLAPALILLSLLGASAIAHTANALRPRAASGVRVAMPLAIAALSIAMLPELNGKIHDPDLFGPGFFRGDLPVIDAQLNELSDTLGPGGKGLVLFRFTPGQNMSGEEPVYNTSTPWPDDAKVIRAHDRGARNADLYRYYAVTKQQADRQVYLYDRRTLQMTRLGTIDNLAAKPSP